MKKSVNKKLVGLLAILASVGIVHAEDGTVEIPNATESQLAIIDDLVGRGFIIPLEDHRNWYQINRKRLVEAMARMAAGDVSAIETIDNLKGIIGDEVDIREVDIFLARLGTQDWARSQ